MTDIAERLRRLPNETVTALAFFSRIPARPRPSLFDLQEAAGAWPIAGFLVALAPALAFLLLRAADFPPLVAALLALALYAALTGAMHEDGLADTFDGMGGGRSPDVRLEIMRDSTHGTFGVLGLVSSAILKVVALAAVGISAFDGALALLFTAVASRSLALWHWHSTEPARRAGLAWAGGRPDFTALILGLGTGAIAMLILLLAIGIGALIGLLLAAAAVGLFSYVVERLLKGHTGDTIGAAQQIAECLLLAGLSIGGANILT